MKSMDAVLWERTQRTPEGCLLFTGAQNHGGYGVINRRGRLILAHRLAWLLAVGEIPDGMCVCHHCDTRSCVEPGHLFLGTYLDNNRDMVNKGRHHNSRKTHCVNGHEFTPANTYLNGRGRHCRACQATFNRAYRARRKQAS